MIDLELTETQLAMQKLAKDFAEREVKPIAAQLDRVQDPAAPDAFPWEMVKKGSRLGLRTLTMPKEYGGPEVDIITLLLVLQQLGLVDASCAKIFSQCWKTVATIAKAGTQAQKDRFLPEIRDDDAYLISLGSTEPGSGSDQQLPYEGADGGTKLTAERKGNGYVLNGMKHFISLGAQCRLCILRARTDKTLGGSKGVSLFLVPKDTPCFSVGSIHDTMGWRAYSGSELIFEDAYVPQENLLGGVEGLSHLALSSTYASLELSILALTIARAAFEAALNYAKERVQGGKHIIEHQAVGLRIAEMYTLIQACDSLCWRAATSVNKGISSEELLVAGKVFSREIAVKVCLQALQIFGGAGVDRGLPVERYLRDAVTLLHAGGTADVLRLHLTNLLAGENLYGKPVK